LLKRLAVFVAIMAALAVNTVPAYAVTDGDLDGNGHPYVGLMVASDAKGTPMWRCSGTLMAPKVFLTAGHCTEAPAAHIEIWFAADVQTNSNRLLSDGTKNPNWNGYPYHGDVSGTPYTHPDYDPARFYFRDLGVVVLKQGVKMAKYGALPKADQMDAYSTSRGTQDVTFTAVGYGLQQSFPDSASFLESAVKIRMVAYPKLDQINTGFTGDFSLLLSNNASTGGTCFGDSGGPNFIGRSNVLGGVTSYGLNGECAGTGGVYRLDRSWNLDWLATFGL
jgi:secreted trypsin-like serine protease